MGQEVQDEDRQAFLHGAQHLLFQKVLPELEPSVPSQFFSFVSQKCFSHQVSHSV